MEHNPHIMSRYDKDLNKLKRRILDMGKHVAEQLGEATEALDQYDAAEVERLVTFDRTINGMHQDIYTRSERMIALRQPMALDLRQVMLPINIAHELERIGDYAKSTAKKAHVLAENDAGALARAKLQEMSAELIAMLDKAMQAYDTNDIELAGQIRKQDLTIDQINRDIFQMQVAAVVDTPEAAEVHFHLAMLARGFERVGDHIVNIARHVHQIVTGVDTKAAD